MLVASTAIATTINHSAKHGRLFSRCRKLQGVRTPMTYRLTCTFIVVIVALAAFVATSHPVAALAALALTALLVVVLSKHF
jgi:hypothetical protein